LLPDAFLAVADEVEKFFLVMVYQFVQRQSLPAAMEWFGISVRWSDMSG